MLSIDYILTCRRSITYEDSNARARAIAWMFAAIDAVEPPIFELALAKILEHGKPWHEERLPMLEDRVRV